MCPINVVFIASYKGILGHKVLHVAHIQRLPTEFQFSFLTHIPVLARSKRSIQVRKYGSIAQVSVLDSVKYCMSDKQKTVSRSTAKHTNLILFTKNWFPFDYFCP